MRVVNVRAAIAAAGAIAAGLAAPSYAQTVYALTTQGGLISFNAATPGSINFIGSITGAGGSSFGYKGIDFRPATSELYLLEEGDVTDSLYQVNLTNATATPKATLGAPLSGGSYGMDFNPTVDRLRVTSTNGQNTPTNVDTGAVLTDTNLAYALGDPNFGDSPFIVGSAYTNSAFNIPGGTGSTTLYNIDARDDILVIQNPPNNGTLTTVGALGFDTHTETGFDIFYDGTNHAYASLTQDTSDGFASGFYSINLQTGQATLIGTIGGGVTIRDIALIPNPSSGALLAVAITAAAMRRRR